MLIEKHPFAPFLPAEAKLLLLGTFPAKPVRWSMDFYYPNFMNDMWRIMGFLFYDDKNRFSIYDGAKGRFDKSSIMEFCREKGIAVSDTASEIRRLRDNASDQFLEVVKPADIIGYLSGLPDCKALVATGTKAAKVISDGFGFGLPASGCSLPVKLDGRTYEFFRMPSTSRAYPLSFEKKAEAYGNMFRSLKML
ncbi:MAG: uracil-DNA glycosylase family protein [Bacteroidales bacterium]|jgi:G:T/U-mismatch repair DNA glycosylase|nr:uracil-DNA glycosylase family protein [Bacteroidales bacterium]